MPSDSEVYTACKIGDESIISSIQNVNSIFFFCGLTPLITACLHNQIRIVKLLLSKGADPNLSDNFRFCPVCIAVQNNFLEIAEILFENGADPNSRDGNMYTCLQLACYYNLPEMVNLCLKYSANPNLGKNGIYPIHYVCNRKPFVCDSPEIFFRLCSSNVDLNLFGGQDLNTPLHIACLTNNHHLVKELLSKKVNPNVQNIRKQTPFWIACFNLNLSTVHALIDAGADVNIPNESGVTPLGILLCFEQMHTLNPRKTIEEIIGETLIEATVETDDEETKEELMKRMKEREKIIKEKIEKRRKRKIKEKTNTKYLISLLRKINAHEKPIEE